MSAINKINNINDSSITINKDSIKDIKDNNPPSPKTNKTLYIIIGVVAGVAIITVIVLLAVLIPKKDKSKHILSSHNSIANSKQSIELLIHGFAGYERRRNLQKEENEIYNAKILGDNFNELNSLNAIIYVDNKTIDFNKNISINITKSTKIEIKFLGTLTTFKEMFKGCGWINKISLKNVETGNVSETISMFEDCFGLTEVKFENMTINNVKSTSKMFRECNFLNHIDIRNFNTDNTKDMSKMFDGCHSLRNTSFIEGLSTKSSENMSEMFSGCLMITSLDLSGFDTSNVKDMSGIFKGLTNLEYFNLIQFNTKNVIYMNEMFENCSSIKSLSLSNFNTEKVIDMSRMFYNCGKLVILDLSSFKLINCKNTKDMLFNTSDALKLSIDNPEIQKLLSINEKEQCIEIFIEGNETNGRRNLEEFEEKIKIMGDSFDELGFSDALIFLDNEKVFFDKNISVKSSKSVKLIIKFYKKITTFKEMFSGCQRIKEVSIKDVETELVLETTSMFEGCSSLTGVKFENTGIYNITSTAKMFQKCSSLNRIEIENFSTNNTKNMSKMFDGCSSLENKTFIEGLSTDSAEILDGMLSGCSKITSLDLSGFNTSNVKDMSGMFKGMTNLEQLEISSFHTENVEYMSEMFESCSSIISLDLSKFNTEKVINMDRMFSSCLKLEEVDLTSFNLTSCNSTEYMFSNTTRELMLSIEKNEEILIRAGMTWSEKQTEFNYTKIPLDLLFLVDATGSMGWAIEKVKQSVVYIAVNILKKECVEIYNLSLAAVFYRDPIDSPSDIHEYFDFNENALEFKVFVINISAEGGADIPEDWAGAFNLSRKLSWRYDSYKFIIHIADAAAHGYDWIDPRNPWDLNVYPEEGKKTDEIITYFARNNFSIAGFIIDDPYSFPRKSYKRAQTLFRSNGNYNYLFKKFSMSLSNETFLNLVYDSFLYIQNSAHLYGIDISEEQGDIDWNQIKKDQSIDFVIIRAGIGNETDSKFNDNYIGAKNAGIPIGIYWYAKALNELEAIEEAETCLKIVEGKQIEFPIYYVIEDDFIFNTSPLYNALIQEFCNTLNRTNYLCGLGSSSNRLQNSFYNEYLDNYQIWTYDLNSSTIDNVDLGIWKYNDSGIIRGINGNVSLDETYINYTKITSDYYCKGVK